MAVQSNFLGSVTVSGDDAKALTRRLARTRETAAGVEAALSGIKLASRFNKRGSVLIKLKSARKTSVGNG